jgi:hypothetical protein
MAERKMKPSEENSIVPTMIRDKFREFKKREREEELKRERENTPAQKPSSESDSKALEELIDQSAAAEDQSSYRKFAKGGMVKKASKSRSHRGDGIATKGFTKGRMY